MELKTYLTIIFRRIWVIVGFFLGFMILVVLVAFLIRPKYSATASLRIQTPKSGGTTYVDFNIFYATRLMNTYANIASSPEMVDSLVKSLNLTKKPKITVNVIADSELIKITTEEGDPALSAILANTVAEKLVENSRLTAEESKQAAGKAINERMDQINEELAVVRKTYESLIIPQNNYLSEIESLNLEIDYDQQLYLSLRSLYEQNLQVARRDEAAFINLQTQITDLEKKIADNKARVSELNQLVAADSTKLSAAQGDITLKEQEYTTLVTQLDQIHALQIIQGENQLQVVEQAVPAVEPSSPNYILVFAVGIILSFFGAVLAAFIVDNLDDTIFTNEQIEKLVQAANLGSVSGDKNFIQRRILKQDPDTQFEINRIRFNISKINQQQDIRSLIFSDSVRRKGDPVLITQLARSAAEAGTKVILIDAKLDDPSLHLLFPDMDHTDGLNQYLSSGIAIRKILHETDLPNLCVIPAGSPATITNPDKFEELLTQLGKNHDLVLIVFPSLMSACDLDEFTSAADAVVMVVENGRSKERDVKSMMKCLQDLDVLLAGYVVTRA
jgi:capsular polysaccharide biosynthesis protein